MLFGRLRVPVENAQAAQARVRPESGLHPVVEAADESRGTLPQRGTSRPSTRTLTVVSAPLDDEYFGLDRLDREELDEA